MQITEFQVFNLHQQPLPSVGAIQKSLGDETQFKVEGVSQPFHADLLSKINNLNQLLPTLTISHKRRILTVPLALLTRHSALFSSLGCNQQQITLTDQKISHRALKRFIEFAQGAKFHLARLSEEEFEKAISTADSLQCAEILKLAEPIVERRANRLAPPELMDYCDRILNCSFHFTPFFGKVFSTIFQKTLFRQSQYNFNKSEQDSFNALLSFLQRTFLPLELNLSHWNPTPKTAQLLLNLNIRKLDFRNCTQPIDITRLPNLVSFKGSAADFPSISNCKSLQSLMLDEMPVTLPPRLKKLHVDEIVHEKLPLVKRIRHFSSDSFLTVEQLSYLSTRVNSLKLCSNSGSLHVDALQQIGLFSNIRTLSLQKIRFDHQIKDPKPLMHLEKVSLFNCGKEVSTWTYASPNLTDVTVETAFEDDTLTGIPVTTTHLELVHSNAHTPSASLLAKLAQLTNLTSLKVSGFDWMNAGFELFAPFLMLKVLIISVEGAFFPTNLETLQSLTQLRIFIVEVGKPWPNEPGEMEILATLPLTDLRIKPQLTSSSSEDDSNDKSVSNVDLTQLGKMTSLRNLNLAGTLHMSNISFVSSLRNLETIHLPGRWLQSLQTLENLPQLRLVNHTASLSSEQRDNFFRAVPSLERLVNTHE